MGFERVCNDAKRIEAYLERDLLEDVGNDTVVLMLRVQ